MYILVIEDNKEYRSLISEYLSQNKLEEKLVIEESNNIEKSLPLLDKKNYDVILLDLNLPESNGIDTIKTIAHHLQSIGKKIPIIVLTGNEDYTIGKEAFNLGIKDFLIKGETKTKELVRAIKFATYSKMLPNRTPLAFLNPFKK